jgi:integrase
MPALLRSMRRGALCGLRRENVDLAGGSLLLTDTSVLSNGEAIASDPTTAAGSRRIRLDAYPGELLKGQQAPHTRGKLAVDTAAALGDWVLTDVGQSLGLAQVSDRHEALASAAGLPQITPHSLRHTSPCTSLAGGTPGHAVTAMLGHADPSARLEMYAHVIPGQADAAGLTASIVRL